MSTNSSTIELWHGPDTIAIIPKSEEEERRQGKIYEIPYL